MRTLSLLLSELRSCSRLSLILRRLSLILTVYEDILIYRSTCFSGQGQQHGLPGAELQRDLQVARSDPCHTPDEGKGLSGRDSDGPGQGYGGLTKIPCTEILVYLNYDRLRWAVIQVERLAGGLLV